MSHLNAKNSLPCVCSSKKMGEAFSSNTTGSFNHMKAAFYRLLFLSNLCIHELHRPYFYFYLSHRKTPPNYDWILHIFHLFPLLRPRPMGRQQAAVFSGCTALWDGKDDNICPPGDWQRTEGRDWKAKWKTEYQKSRQEAAEVRRVKVCV